MGEPLLFLLVAGAGVAVGLPGAGWVVAKHGVKADRLGLAGWPSRQVWCALRAVGLTLAPARSCAGALATCWGPPGQGASRGPSRPRGLHRSW